VEALRLAVFIIGAKLLTLFQLFPFIPNDIREPQFGLTPILSDCSLVTEASPRSKVSVFLHWSSLIIECAQVHLDIR